MRCLACPSPRSIALASSTSWAAVSSGCRPGFAEEELEGIRRLDRGGEERGRRLPIVLADLEPARLKLADDPLDLDRVEPERLQDLHQLRALDRARRLGGLEHPLEVFALEERLEVDRRLGPVSGRHLRLSPNNPCRCLVGRAAPIVPAAFRGTRDRRIAVATRRPEARGRGDKARPGGEPGVLGVVEAQDSVSPRAQRTPQPGSGSPRARVRRLFVLRHPRHDVGIGALSESSGGRAPKPSSLSHFQQTTASARRIGRRPDPFMDTVGGAPRWPPGVREAAPRQKARGPKGKTCASSQW